MPEPWVTSPHNTMRSAFWSGAIMCSQTPETTSPIAKPDRPDVRPPKNAAARKRARFNSSIAVAPEAKGRSAWINCDLRGRRPDPPSLMGCFRDRQPPKHHRSPPFTEGDGAWARALEARATVVGPTVLHL